MAQFQAMHKYFAVFLALLAINDSLLTYGRRMIKPLNQHSSLNTHTVALAEDNPHRTLLPIHGTNVVHVPTASSAKKAESSKTQNNDVARFEEVSGAPYTDAFRPTTPGGSPGVGHPKFADVKAVMASVQSPDVKVSLSGVSKNDFRPTDPGNSPGVGHALHN